MTHLEDPAIHFAIEPVTDGIALNHDLRALSQLDRLILPQWGDSSAARTGRMHPAEARLAGFHTKFITRHRVGGGGPIAAQDQPGPALLRPANARPHPPVASVAVGRGQSDAAVGARTRSDPPVFPGGTLSEPVGTDFRRLVKAARPLAHWVAVRTRWRFRPVGLPLGCPTQPHHPPRLRLIQTIQRQQLHLLKAPVVRLETQLAGGHQRVIRHRAQELAVDPHPMLTADAGKLHRELPTLRQRPRQREGLQQRLPARARIAHYIRLLRPELQGVLGPRARRQARDQLHRPLRLRRGRRHPQRRVPQQAVRVCSENPILPHPQQPSLQGTATPSLDPLRRCQVGEGDHLPAACQRGAWGSTRPGLDSYRHARFRLAQTIHVDHLHVLQVGVRAVKEKLAQAIHRLDGQRGQRHSVHLYKDPVVDHRKLSLLPVRIARDVLRPQICQGRARSAIRQTHIHPLVPKAHR